MPQDDVAQALVPCVEAMFHHAGAELAERLGSPVETTVAFGGRMAPQEWTERLGGPCLVVTGSLGGAVAGAVAFVLRKDDALRLAARVGSEGADDLAERLKEPLREADTAAVVFALVKKAKR